MSSQITTAMVNQFRANIELLLQQKGSRLRNAVSETSIDAEMTSHDRIGAVEAQPVTNRHGDSPLMETPHDRRWIAGTDYEWGDLIDKKDKIRLLTDPTSAYAQNARFAFERSMDDVIIAAANASAATGKTGTGSTAFDSGMSIASTYEEDTGTDASNLTIGKLRRAKYLLDLQEADDDDRHAAIGPLQLQSLLTSVAVTSQDYNTVKALVDGKVNSFLGFQFHRSNRLSKSGNVRKCLFWQKRGLLLGVGQDIQVEIAARADKRFSTYVYVSMMIGAVRMQEGLVGNILCDESASLAAGS